MRSWRAPLVAAVAVAVTVSACRRAPSPAPAPPALRVVCTTFPMYLMTLNVAAGRGDVRVDIMLPAAMGCPHDYVLTPQDMQKIAGADLLIANGLGLEEFLGEPIARANPKIKVVDTSEGVSEVIWASEGGPGGTAGKVRNPHMFASPRLAARIAQNIAAALEAADPAGASTFSQHAARYAARLTELGAACAAMSQGLRSRRIVTEHGVFDYFARDCGLEIAAVVEETPGQEPAAARMLALVREIRQSSAGALFTEPQYPGRVGRTIAREAGIPAAVLDPVASGPDDPPLDYYERVMRRNLETLQRTLK